MPIQFGKTWWGEHWLQSLQHVDYDNRLPRGASYARNGYVKDVKIKDNQIVAKVAGSRRTPYKVTVIVPPFFEEQVEVLMDEIIKRPALISKLLNRELDPVILTIAEEAGLKVFPRQWTDVKMQCSCPDWAVTCKHLAAVIYMVSREIDNNPFLVFEIHKVNLLDELKKRGIFIADQKKTEIPQLGNLLKTKKIRNQQFDEDPVYDRVDFARLHDISDPLVQLLPDAPPFYSAANFRDKFASQFLRNGKEAKRVLNKKLDFEAVFLSVNKPSTITYRSTCSLSVDANNKLHIAGENHAFQTLEQLIPAIFSLNPDHLPDYQYSVVALHKILFASLHLVANGNVVPQIVRLENKDYLVRWLPALIDAEVRLLVEKLTKILPPDLLLSPKMVGKNEQLLSVVNQAVELLSLFISKLITRLSRPSSGDLFEEIFFKKNVPEIFALEAINSANK